LRTLLFLVILATTLSLAACGDGPDTAAPLPATQQATTVPPKTIPTPVEDYNYRPTSFSCSGGSVLLTGIQIDQRIFQHQVESFTLVTCGEFIAFNSQAFSILLANRNEQQPFRSVEELTRYAEEILRGGSKVDSYLVLDGVETADWLRLFPNEVSTGPIA